MDDDDRRTPERDEERGTAPDAPPAPEAAVPEAAVRETAPEKAPAPVPLLVPEAAPDRAYVTDVRAETPGWLREARGLADGNGLEGIGAALGRLAADRGRPSFRVAVVGEFNRGKSTVVNRLLGRDVLPTGSLPLQRVSAVVTADREEALRVTRPDGRREVLPLPAPAEFWAGLGPSDEGGATGASGSGSSSGSGGGDGDRSAYDGGRPPGAAYDGGGADEPRGPSSPAGGAGPDGPGLDGPGANGPGADEPGSGTSGGAGAHDDRRAAADPAVTLTVDSEWLASLDADLVDTPGLNSGDPQSLAQVRGALGECDAALFVVSALSPLGITEHLLLKEEVLCRHLSLTAVVVTRLDLIDPDDREEALRDIEARVHEVAGVPVLPAPAPGGGEGELASLRDLVAGFAANGGRALWRDRRIAAQIADHCDAVTALASEAAAAALLDRPEAEKRAARARAELADEELGWSELENELTRRRLDLGRALREHVHKNRDTVIERLRRELERARDPKSWWERDLPFRLRHELSLLAREAERIALRPAFAADAAWLEAEVARRLPAAGRSPRPGELDLTVEPAAGGQVAGLSGARLINRLGAQGGSIVGYLVAAARSAPVPMLYGIGFSLIGGVIAEVSIRTATEEQRREVDAVLVRVVDESTAGFQRRAEEALGEVCADAFEFLRQSRLAWRDTRRTAAEALDASGVRQTDWTEPARSAASLAARIRAALRG